MCGRYEVPLEVAPWREVYELLAVPPLPAGSEPHGEIRPTDPAPILRNDGPRELSLAEWWLRGPWDARDEKLTLFNARDDRLDEPFWRDIAETQRCVIPATAYFEWMDVGTKRKRKMRIAGADSKPIVFAGLWNEWHHKLSCTIVTTSPETDIAYIHDRMPAILPPELIDTWLSPERVPIGALASLVNGRRRVPLKAVEARPESTNLSLF